MKIVVALFLLFVILKSESCKKGAAIPSCIKRKIEEIQSQPRYNPPATVHRYLYKGEYVYLFSSPCCDQFNYLYDRNCKVLCAPTGGFTGRGDGNCPTFKDMATDETLIWKDDR